MKHSDLQKDFIAVWKKVKHSSLQGLNDIIHFIYNIILHIDVFICSRNRPFGPGKSFTSLKFATDRECTLVQKMHTHIHIYSNLLHTDDTHTYIHYCTFTETYYAHTQTHTHLQ